MRTCRPISTESVRVSRLCPSGPTYPWTFTVLDDAAVNAFAVPGGYLYVTRGILTHFNSEAELAAVLGHEVGHVTARHSVEQMSRQQLLGGLLGVGAILSEEVRSVAGVGTAALGVLNLSHSRGDEHQADRLGIRYALREDYDPREAIKVHTMLGRQTEARGGRGVPNWLATHPSSADRIERIQSQVDEIPDATLASARVLADDYLTEVDGVAFGPDPRDGFFQNARFLHPDLEFEFTFPNQWQTMNLPQAVVGAEPQRGRDYPAYALGEGSCRRVTRVFARRGHSAGCRRSHDRQWVSRDGRHVRGDESGQHYRGSRRIHRLRRPDLPDSRIHDEREVRNVR